MTHTHGNSNRYTTFVLISVYHICSGGLVLFPYFFFFWGGGFTSVPFMSINSCRSLATHLHTPALFERLCSLETNSSRLAPLTYAYLKFLATVIFPLPLFHQLINSNDVPDCRQRRRLRPHRHLKPNGVLDISNDPLESVVRPTGVRQCEGAHSLITCV